MQFKIDNLDVEIYENRVVMGLSAAADIKNRFTKLLETKDKINVIFAAAPSQLDALRVLAADKDIEWNRINAYHMDEYIGIGKDSPQGFGNFLKRHLFSLVPFHSVNYIDNLAKNPSEEAARYGRLVQDNMPDVVVMGIGENGHIAFNDPHVADFSDKHIAKVVVLDENCRRQQVNDGCFANINDVPTEAVTLTIPTLVSAPNIFCIVPAATKSRAVFNTLYGKVNETCPASVLRLHNNAKLYLDNLSSVLVTDKMKKDEKN